MVPEPPPDEGDIQCARAEYPPQVHSVKFLGQVHDSDGSRSFARTHGCSTLLNYEPVFLFNDTFEIFRPSHSAWLEYTPIASITAAFGSPSNPTVTTYPTYTDRRRIPQFIPFSRTEKAAGATRGCYLTVFNSVVQVPEREFGVVWFMKMRDCRSDGGDADVFCGVGVAEVKIDGEGMPGCDRKEELVFDGLGPRWGDISTVIHGDYIYLYGSGTPTSFANDGSHNDPVYQTSHPSTTSASKFDVPIYLCRVPYRNRAYWHAENYKYWNGRDFVSFPQASKSSVAYSPHRRGKLAPPPPSEFKCVMKNIQSGTVMHAQLFTERGHFIFVGCELGGGGDKEEAMVKMRLADEPMGPWFGEASLFDLNSVDRGNRGVKFGVHAHSWASDLRNGEIMVSWTESWPGGVEMARVRLVMQPGPRSIMMPTTTATTVVQSSRHHRKNARMVIGYRFDEEPIPEDPEPELEPESEPENEADQVLKFRKREKAHNKALAKLAGIYRREEDSDTDTESVFEFKMAFQKLLAPPPRPASPSSFSSESPSPPPAQNSPGGPSPPTVLRPYSGYDQRILVPGDISGSWIMEEPNSHYSGDATNRRKNQDQQIANLKKELEAVANRGNRTNNSSTDSSPQANAQFSWLDTSDTNTEYSTSISPVSSPIAVSTNPLHRYPSGPNAHQNVNPCSPYAASPPLPDIEAAMGSFPLSIFETHSSSPTSTATITIGKKHRVKRLLWRKKTQEEAEVEEVVGDGGEKKGWKNSLKKSAIVKFLMSGD